jgi:hypothetical protein
VEETHNSVQQKKIDDIEEQDFIYKVKCEARETISLRDTVKLTRAYDDPLSNAGKKKST